MNSIFQSSDIFNADVEGVQEALGKEESEMSALQNMPTELYVPMISRLDPSLPIEKLGRGNSENVLWDTLRTWVRVAMASRVLFDRVMQGFYEHPIFTSLVSDVETERRGSYSLFQALRPAVDFVRAMSHLGGKIGLFNKSNVFLQEPIESFFEVFRNLNWVAQGFERKLNIVASTPRFLFEACEKRWLPQSTIFVCREEYRKKNKGHDLSECIDAIEKWTIDGPVDEARLLRAVRYNAKNFFNLPARLQFKQEYILAAADDDEVMDTVLWRNAELRLNRDFALEIVRTTGRRLQLFPHFQNDNEIVLAAVQQDGQALLFASEELQKDPTVVLAAVQQNERALRLASKELQKDSTIVLAAVRQGGGALEYASWDLKNDSTIVLAAVQRCWYALQYASEALQNDPEIVLAAVQQHGSALWLTSKRFRKDPTIVLAAVQQNGQALGYASWELKNDSTIVLAAVQQDGSALKYASEALKNDSTIVLAAVQQNGMALQYADASLKKDITIAFEAVQNNRHAIRYVHDDLKEHPKITALKTSPGRRVWEVLE